MNMYFYRLWLPISLVAHALLLLALMFIRITAQAESPAMTDYIRVLSITDPVPVTNAVEAIPPRQIRENVVVPPGVQRPQALTQHGQSEKFVPIPGSGAKPTVAPSVMTAKTGVVEVPTGQPDGIGTESSGDPGPSGPSYGAGLGRKGAAVYPKTALDEGMEGSVVVSVLVGTDGNMESASINQSSGYQVLDRQALRDVRSWHFTPAMEKGTPVSGTIKIRFSYANGVVEGTPL